MIKKKPRSAKPNTPYQTTKHHRYHNVTYFVKIRHGTIAKWRDKWESNRARHNPQTFIKAPRPLNTM